MGTPAQWALSNFNVFIEVEQLSRVVEVLHMLVELKPANDSND